MVEIEEFVYWEMFRCLIVKKGDWMEVDNFWGFWNKVVWFVIDKGYELVLVWVVVKDIYLDDIWKLVLGCWFFVILGLKVRYLKFYIYFG